MTEEWLTDVRKYDAHADEAVVSAIVRHCGIALRNRDSSLVSFSDPTETGRVRDNFLKKKLGRTEDDATLDSAIAAVGDRMQGDPTKNRVTVYYLLADRFGMLNVFGGGAPAAGAATGGAAVGAAAGMAAVGATAPASGNPAATFAMSTTASAFDDSAATNPRPTAAAPPASTPRPMAAIRSARRAAGPYGSSTAIGVGDIAWGWVAVLVGGILLAAFLAISLAQMRSGPPPAFSDAAVGAAPVLPVATVAVRAAPVPQGAGVVANDRDAKPMLTIYFDTGRAEVSDQFTAAAANVRTYIDAHPGASLAVSGFNDPTGNAAANAELSKNRAKNTKVALEQLGVAADRVVLEKPTETTGTGASNTESRRVEVVVKE